MPPPPSPSATALGVPRPGGPGSLADRTVSRVGYGAMQLDRLRGDRGAAVALLRRAVELGVDHVDTAQFYGDGFVNERDPRGRLVPRTASWSSARSAPTPTRTARIPLRPAQRPEQLRASVEDNLRSLGVEQIPVVNLRRLDAGPGLRAEGDQVVDLDDQLAVMTALRDEGKIGAIGLSSVTLDGLRRALPAGIACVQNAYSLVDARRRGHAALCARRGHRLGAVLPARRRVPRPCRR